MEILTIVLLLMGLFWTVAGVVTEDMSMFIYAGTFYLCCGIILARLNTERSNNVSVAKSE